MSSLYSLNLPLCRTVQWFWVLSRFPTSQNHWGDEEEFNQGIVSLYACMGFQVGGACQGATSFLCFPKANGRFVVAFLPQITVLL